jgi:hypothetical protein
MDKRQALTMLELRTALEASWSSETAYMHVYEKGNPALGNCYPTSRVVQHYFPKTEIVEGEVNTPKGIEKHFWNLLIAENIEYHIDLSWQQFPQGSYVTAYKSRDRHKLGDSQKTLNRVKLLLSRVQDFLENH